MNQYTVRFTNVKTYYEFFECIIEGLGFSTWCGKNLDAVWDMLTSDIKIPAIIYIEGSHTIPQLLYDKYKEFLDLLNEVVEWYKKNNCYLEIKII